MCDIFEGLNREQGEAVKNTEGPLLILAGAGSGKTRVITCRTAYLIRECGVNPFNILAITFTNKASGEMRQRIDKMVGFGSEGIWVSTFHSMGVRILRRYIDRIGFDNSFSIYDRDDQKTLMKDVCKRLEIDTKYLPERAIISRISHYKDELVSVQEVEREASLDFTLKDIARAYRAYEEALRSNNALDFDDLIVKTDELFRKDRQVLQGYQDRFRYIMVDEYQDTNTAQFELVRLLADKYRNICVVGDDDQSIYKFRGANIRNILDFEKVYENAGVIRLEQNYRSTQNILDAANNVIKNNTSRKEKALWSDRGRGALIHKEILDTAYQEAEYVASSIKDRKKKYDRDYNDFAVLYRTNAQSRILEEKFLMSSVPYTIVGGVNFYSRREIKDIVAYLKTIDNGNDDIAVKRIINVPKRGIGQTTINKIQDLAIKKGITFYEALKHAGETGAKRSVGKITEFIELIEGFRNILKKGSLEELVNEVIEKTEYIENLDAVDEDDLETRVENIEEFINKVIAFEEEDPGTEDNDYLLSEKKEEDPDLSEEGNKAILSRFLEDVALVSDIDDVREDDDRVLLMTLHSAKGLEFPCVYITGMEEGLFPGYGALSSELGEELEEERRLCYVGITRAKDELTFTAAKTRMQRGELQYNTPSSFLFEIPDELFDTGVRKKTEKPRISIVKPVKKSSKIPFSSLMKGSDIMGIEKKKPDYNEGDRVSHIKFGEGTVISIVDGSKDYEVTVQFDKAGIKKMLAGFAKLNRL